MKGKDTNLYNKHITSFPRIYPNMADMLIKDYGLEETDIIQVRHTRIVDRPMGYHESGKEKIYRNWQTNWKHPFKGMVKDFRPFVKLLCEKTIWKKHNETRTKE